MTFRQSRRVAGIETRAVVLDAQFHRVFSELQRNVDVFRISVFDGVGQDSCASSNKCPAMKSGNSRSSPLTVTLVCTGLRVERLAATSRKTSARWRPLSDWARRFHTERRTSSRLCAKSCLAKSRCCRLRCDSVWWSASETSRLVGNPGQSLLHRVMQIHRHALAFAQGGIELDFRIAARAGFKGKRRRALDDLPPQ